MSKFHITNKFKKDNPEYDLCKDNAMCCDDDCKKCAQRIYKAYMNERNKQVTAYWTGRLTSDNAFAEGYASWFTEEDKRRYDDMEKHTTHCSNCKGGFDDRDVVDWRYCPYCGATIVKKETKSRIKELEKNKMKDDSQ